MTRQLRTTIFFLFQILVTGLENPQGFDFSFLESKNVFLPVNGRLKYFLARFEQTLPS